MKKVSLLVLASLLAVLLMVPSLTSAEEPKYGGTLIFAAEADLTQLDPHKDITAAGGRVFQLTCNSLVEPDKNFDMKPSLAESWDISADGKDWTFHLRKGVKFHNGRDFTAEDVKWNFDRIMDPEVGTAIKSRFPILDRVEVVDRFTVKFTLTRPSGSFLAAHGGISTRAPMIARECVDEGGAVTHPIGTGPFEFVEWKTNDYIKLKKFKDYWAEGLPYLDEIIMKPVPDETVRFTALRTGDVDMAVFLPVDDVARALETPSEDVQYSLYPVGYAYFIHFNVTKPPFDDKRVRQAIAYAIDKQELLEGVALGFGEIIDQQFSKESYWHCDLPQIARDIDKAKALLAEAGYPNGLEVTLSTTQAYPTLMRGAQIIQSQVKEAGVDVKLEVGDWSALISQLTSGEFMMSVIGPSAFADPGQYYSICLVPDTAFSWFFANGYNNPQVNELLEKADSITDPAKRKKLYTRILEIVNEEAPWVYYVLDKNPVGWRSYVKGFEPHINADLVYAGGGLQYTWLDK